jgi:hypothetical protein
MDDPCLMCMVNNQTRYWNCTESCHAKLQWLNSHAQERVAESAHSSIARLAKQREALRDD